MDPTKEQHRILRKSREKWDGAPGTDYANVWGRKLEPYTGSAASPRPKKERQANSNVRSMFIIFLVHKKHSFRQAKQMCEDFGQNFGDRRTQCCITTIKPSHTSVFTGKFLTKNNLTVVPHPPYFFVFPRLKMKLKRRHFDTTEVTEAESQAVLNTHRTRLTKWQKRWDWCMRASSPGNYG
jgi:hypothetical protein